MELMVEEISTEELAKAMFSQLIKLHRQNLSLRRRIKRLQTEVANNRSRPNKKAVRLRDLGY